MTSFDDRERAYESKFAHDEEMQFRANARRNKLLGHWAAALLGKTGAEADAYAIEVVKSDFAEAGDDDVLRKVAGDLAGKVSAADVRVQMDALLAEAKRQLASDA
jgi:hypothetical protein